MPSDFQPHPAFRSGHAQTLAAFLLFGHGGIERAAQHVVPLDDGDRLVLHDDCPPAWRPGDRVAAIVHGVCGCHASPYCSRLANRLNAAGVRTFRLDLRGCGAGLALARRSYHGGCSADLLAAVRWIETHCPGSPIAAVGFSLGGNILLKMLGESPGLPPALDRAAAVSTPVDLLQTAHRLKRGLSRFYDRYFARLLWKQVHARRQACPEMLFGTFPRRPRTIWEFDDHFTAPLGGWSSAEDYYRQSSSAPLLASIRVPTLILASADDPMVPIATLESAPLSPAITLRVTRFGGHLGFIARRNADSDRHWMDWRVVEWTVKPGAGE